MEKDTEYMRSEYMPRAAAVYDAVMKILHGVESHVNISG